MDREYDANKIFCVNAEFQVLICQQCQYAVPRRQVRAHLTSSQNRIPSAWAESIHTTVQQWKYIDDDPTVDGWPHQIEKPIPELPIHQDGILCLQCKMYICRQIKDMKMHWWNAHQYRVQQGRGRPNPVQAQAIQASIDDAYPRVPGAVY